MSKSRKTPKATKRVDPSSSSKAKVRALDPLGFGWRPGRPSKYDPKFCDDIIIYARKGKTFEEFASDLNIHRDTLSEWASVYPDFSDARRKAKQEAELYMIKLGQRHMLDKRLSAPKKDIDGKMIRKERWLNQSMWQFFMKCRFGWREDPVETSEDGDVEFDFE